VQVGAFRDEATAKRLVDKLHEQNFTSARAVKRGGDGDSAPRPAAAPADRSAPSTSAGGDQYDVFVSGISAADLNRRLSAKGLTAEVSSGGLVIRPSLPLRDAVALSKDLAVEGFKVQVRRAGTTGTTGSAGTSTTESPKPVTPRAAETASTGGGDTLYRVRVGSFPDRGGAVTALRELESKGYKGYIARGDE
jgi:hypothetical protein